MDNQFLAGLSDTHRLSVLSNTHHPPSVPGHLRAMGLAPYVSQVVTSVEFGRRKPHPSIFHHALERLGSAPDQAIYVGDDYAADYLGATAAGMRCILIDPEAKAPRARIPSSELAPRDRRQVAVNVGAGIVG